MSMWKNEQYDLSPEIDVYEQCCENCRNENCPFQYWLNSMENEDGTISSDSLCEYEIDLEAPMSFRERQHRRKAVMQQCREDGVIKDGELIWCIHWMA